MVPRVSVNRLDWDVPSYVDHVLKPRVQHLQLSLGDLRGLILSEQEVGHHLRNHPLSRVSDMGLVRLSGCECSVRNEVPKRVFGVNLLITATSLRSSDIS